jgi:hypothetical protein
MNKAKLAEVAISGGKVVIEYLGKFFKTTKPIANAIKKNNPRVRIVTKPPKGININNLKPPPKSLNQPMNPKTGKFQKPAPSPAIKKPGGNTSVSPKPKIDKKPPAALKNKPKNVTKTGPKKPSPRPMKDVTPSNIKVRTDPKIPGRKPMTLGPAGLRISTLDLEADVKATPIKKPTKKPRERPTPKTKTDRKYVPPNVQEKKKKTTTKKPTVKPKKTVPNKKPKPNPLTGVKEFRRKSLRSSRIGTDAGDGMVWIVGNNTNAFTRVKPSDERVNKQKKIRTILKGMDK